MKRKIKFILVMTIIACSLLGPYAVFRVTRSWNDRGVVTHVDGYFDGESWHFPADISTQYHGVISVDDQFVKMNQNVTIIATWYPWGFDYTVS